MNNRVSRPMSSSERRPTMPKSTSPISSTLLITSTLAGCGSPWKAPCLKIISIQVLATLFASVRSGGELPSQHVGVPALRVVVELGVDRGGEPVHHGAHVYEVERPHPF